MVVIHKQTSVGAWDKFNRREEQSSFFDAVLSVESKRYFLHPHICLNTVKSAYNSTQETGHTPSYKTPISVWQQVKKQLLSINRSDYMYIVYVWTNGAINLGQLNIH